MLQRLVKSHTAPLAAGLKLALALTLPTALHAQSGEQELSARADTIGSADTAGLLASAPAPGSQSASITAGFEVNEGRTETRGYSIDAIWARMSESGMLLRLDGTLKRGEYRAAPGQDRIVVDDMYELAVGLVRPIAGSFSLLASGTWKRDEPVGLKHRFLAQAGVGFTFVKGRQLLFTIGPVVGIGNQDNAASNGADGIPLLGGVQTLSWRASETFGIETEFHGYSNLDDSDDFVLDFTVAGTSQINSRLGLKASYTYTREGIHPQEVSEMQRRLEFGVTINLINGG